MATGFGLIQCVKGLMSFEDEVSRYMRFPAISLSPPPQDLKDAIEQVRHGNEVAARHRKRTASLPTRLVGFVVGSLNTSGVGFIRSMSTLERHAELVYAESLFEKVCSFIYARRSSPSCSMRFRK